MKRSGYLNRYTPLARRRETPRRMPGKDEQRLAWVRQQACSLVGYPGHRCWGPLDPHHAGHGRAEPDPDLRKTSDKTAVPICRGGHQEIERLEGPFKGWTWEQARELQDRLIARAQANYRAYLERR